MLPNWQHGTPYHSAWLLRHIYFSAWLCAFWKDFRITSFFLYLSLNTLDCLLKRKLEAIEALRKAWDAGFRDADWARRDPDLALLHGDPDFEGLYPERTAATDGRKVS